MKISEVYKIVCKAINLKKEVAIMKFKQTHDILPYKLYAVMGTAIVETVITGLHATIEGLSWKNERITKKVLESDIEILNNHVIKNEDIRLEYKQDHGAWSCSGFMTWKEYSKKDYYGYKDNPLLLKELKKQVELYEPREGYAACAYCGKQNPIDKLKPFTIIARQYPGGQTTNKYCPDSGCGGMDQMAHEG